jgi:hypothetical protein
MRQKVGKENERFKICCLSASDRHTHVTIVIFMTLVKQLVPHVDPIPDTFEGQYLSLKEVFENLEFYAYFERVQSTIYPLTSSFHRAHSSIG